MRFCPKYVSANLTAYCLIDVCRLVLDREMKGSVVLVSSTHFWIGPWRVDPELNKISNAGRVTTVEPRAMRTLCYLHQNQGHPVSRDELLDKVWGKQALTDHAISVVIVSLRQALEDDAQNPKYLKTIRKKGYCLIAEGETTGGAPEGHLYARPVQKNLYSKRSRTVLGVLAVMTISALLIAVGSVRSCNIT